MFYDLDAIQGQYLATQLPFKHGHGELLDTLRRSESMILPDINFGPPGISNLGEGIIP